MRLTARGRLDRPPAPHAGVDAPNELQASSRRQVWFNPNEPEDTPIYLRDALSPGHVIHGPAVIEQLDATTLVYPGDKATIDAGLNLLVELAS